MCGVTGYTVKPIQANICLPKYCRLQLTIEMMHKFDGVGILPTIIPGSSEVSFVFNKVLDKVVQNFADYLYCATSSHYRLSA